MFSIFFLLAAVFTQGFADVVFTAEPCDRETFGLKPIQGDGSRYKQCGPSSRVWIVPCAPQMKFDPVEKVCKEQQETRRSDKYRSRRPTVTTASPAPEEFVFSTNRPKRPRIKTKGKKKTTTPIPATLPFFTVPPTTTVIPALPSTVDLPKTAFPAPAMTVATTIRPEYTVKYNGENMTEEELLRRLVDLVKAQKGAAEKEKAAVEEKERLLETQRRREEEMKEEERRRAVEMADKLRREETQRKIAEEMLEKQRLEEERRVAMERAEMQRKREEERRRQAEEMEEMQRKEEQRRIAMERAEMERRREEERRQLAERAEKKRQEEVARQRVEKQRQEEERRIAEERAEKQRQEEETRRIMDKQRKEEEHRLAMERAETQRKEQEKVAAMERAEKQRQHAEKIKKQKADEEEKLKREMEEQIRRERERAERERQSFNRLPSTVTQQPEFNIIRFPPGPTPSGWVESPSSWRPPVDVFSSRPETTPQPLRSTTVALMMSSCVPNGDCPFSYDEDQFCAHPEDPALYLQCTPFIGRRGRWTPRHCPPGLLFSTHLGRCEKDPYSAYNPKGRVVIPRLPEETNEVTWQGNRELPMAVTPMYPERAIQNTIDSFPKDLLPVVKPIHPEDLYKPKLESDDYEELDLSRIHPLFPRVQPSFLNNFLPFQPLQDGLQRDDNIIGAVFKPFIKNVALRQTKNFLDRVLSDEEVKRLEEEKDRLRVEGGNGSR